MRFEIRAETVLFLLSLRESVSTYNFKTLQGEFLCVLSLRVPLCGLGFTPRLFYLCSFLTGSLMRFAIHAETVLFLLSLRESVSFVFFHRAPPHSPFL